MPALDVTRVIHRVGLWCVRLFYVGWVWELLSQARRDAAECAAAPAWAVADQELATTIAATLADLPADLGREIIDKAEAMLVDWAADFDPVTLGALGARILEHVAPEVAEQREADLLARQQARAHRKRGFTLSPRGNGQVRLSGYLDVTGAATVSAALDPLCHPRHDPAEARTRHSAARTRWSTSATACCAATRTCPAAAVIRLKWSSRSRTPC